MRHCKKKGRLNRSISWRKATLKSLANDLFKYQRIETTEAKAKALRSFAEPIITIAKKNPKSVAARRQVFSKLCNKTIVKSLFDEIAPLYKDIDGGYTRIMLAGNRRGDGAKLVVMELTKRTISDDKLLGEKTEKLAKLKKKDKTSAKDAKAEEVTETNKEQTSEKSGASAKKGKVKGKIKIEKSKAEDKKPAKKGILKRFRRKSI